MQDVIPDIDRWLAQGKSIALATVVNTWGSAPRRVGARMAMTPDGEITGSVSGGCVEGAVFDAAVETLRTGKPQLLHFGVADETAWEVGLACGGQIDVFVQPLDRALYDRQRAAWVENQPFVGLTILRGPLDLVGQGAVSVAGGDLEGSLGPDQLPGILRIVNESLARRETRRLELPLPDGPVELLVEIVAPPPTLIMVGGVHIAVALASIAKALGYRTVVIDPRKAFGSAERFPHVDQLIQKWPDEVLESVGLNESTAVALLTHDPKIDDPALRLVLPSPVFYIGALGSRKTQEKRRNRMREAGFSEQVIDRIRGPIGLPIGARSPEEIALSIMAEVVAARNGQLEAVTPAGV